MAPTLVPPEAMRATSDAPAQTAAHSEIITLQQFIDPDTGAVLYADPGEHPPRAAGRWGPATVRDPNATSGDLFVDNGRISLTQRGAQTAAISTLPTETMAAGWEEIRDTMRAMEEGRSKGNELVMRPGGAIARENETGESEPDPISILPREVMAAAAVTTASDGRLAITFEDLQAVERLDPDNLGHWTPIYRPLAGFTFTLSADPFPGLPQFKFFVFRSAPDGGLWRTAVLAPNMDNRYGHDSHVLAVRVGSEPRAVLCGPGGRAARTLDEAWRHAGKWKIYTAAKMSNKDPGFSL